MILNHFKVEKSQNVEYFNSHNFFRFIPLNIFIVHHRNTAFYKLIRQFERLQKYFDKSVNNTFKLDIYIFFLMHLAFTVHVNDRVTVILCISMTTNSNVFGAGVSENILTNFHATLNHPCEGFACVRVQKCYLIFIISFPSV